jgi:hypothetical protein
MKNPLTIWNHFAYRHRVWAYLIILSTTLLLASGCLTAVFEPLHPSASILTWDNLTWLLTMLGIVTTGALLLVFAVPSRSPWD